MKRALVGIVAAALLVPASASAVTYVGKVKGDPGSQISFIKHRVNGKLKVTDIEFAALDAECENGPSSQSGPIYSNGRIGGGEFDVRYESSSFKQRFAGELRPNDRARGIIRSRVDTGAPPTGVCKTARLEWRAHKDVN